MKSSRQREEKEQRRNQIIIGVFMVVLMVGSTVGYFIADDNSSSGSLEFEGKDGKKYSFEPSGGKYYTEINETQFSFYSHPAQALEMNVSPLAMDIIRNSQVVGLTFDPGSEDIQFIELVRLDMSNDFAEKNKYVVSGVIQNSSLYNLPIITCSNSSYATPVIQFVESNNTVVYAIDSCIIVEGRKFDFLEFRDYVAYSMNGLI